MNGAHDAADEASNESTLEVVAELRGRAVLVEDGALYLGRNYQMLRTTDEGRTWTALPSLPRSPVRRVAELSRLACRLLRHEIRALVRPAEGSYVATSRQGVFHGREGERWMKPSAVQEDGLPYKPPMRLTTGPDGVVLWGEYSIRREGRPIRIFASRDGGRHFEIAHTFAGGSVLHVHNLQYDAQRDHYWVFVGDHGDEPGIGQLSSDLQRFEWLRKGGQEVRAVVAFDFGDRLVYATDSELETNALISLDKSSGRTERLREFDGSCIYGCRFGGLYAISTTVEPSPVNQSPWSSLWVSRDGERWSRAYRARKDRWSAWYLQFGSVVLPSGASASETLAFSGQAVEGLDGRTRLARLRPA